MSSRLQQLVFADHIAKLADHADRVNEPEISAALYAVAIGIHDGSLVEAVIEALDEIDFGEQARAIAKKN